MSNSMSPSNETSELRDVRKKKRHARQRVRGAWISFCGRIVAQFVGSAASILLALVLLGKYQSAPAAHAGAAERTRKTPPAGLAVTAGEGGPLLVVLSLDNLSGDARRDLAAAINAALARPPALQDTAAPKPAAVEPPADLTAARGKKADDRPDLVVARSLDAASELRK